MNENQAGMINGLLERIPAEYRPLFNELAEFVISLGYLPKRSPTKDFAVDFSNRKAKRTILKLEEKEQKHGDYKYGERGVPGIRMKFFASQQYSEIFRTGVKNVIEEFGGKYTGCYGCEKCGPTLQGYSYQYPDGRQVFRCGLELISIFGFSAASLDEMKALLKQQAEYFAAMADSQAS
jgi:hypothetical protein